MAQEISLEMVRSHLADLGYVEVPDDVLDEFREELSRRIRSKAAEDIPAPLQEKQKVSKQAQEPEIGQYADAKNMLRTRRPHTSYERQRKVEAEDRQSLHGMHYDGDGSEEEKENVVPDSGRQPKAPNELSRSVCSISSVKSCSSGVIRPSTQMYGRLQKKSDPVAGYMKMKQCWDVSLPSSRQSRSYVKPSSLQPPIERQIWKATHPLQNSMGTSDYVVPSSKPRTRERISVRDCAKWTDVYQPRKTDRVEANQVIKEYVPPDAKRRDDVRWRTRVMMLS
ncbi:hypothetical protein GUITHDRAFT_144965 [Guillardia theta CCMP2712]|uniref:Centriolar and ciliogenesis-associated protein HYLS1 C-terminal domain-containing protein n=1 Tax=Guillardia theta (strain CCMP2712) TaxID=905079 RepID=L1IP03_GUITC|nr:hypothetical protein GUITHDRAFT_144965 [Guillardia theta CCMP2712]EKX37550.1 hypothetical protein GUITHDRAFT_144965 [Guillardia theta CCMP2712]|eukprot:XP_005824530.1 hypothetical protein GUITHDRAFT_144965 [Guillardia theta CCMP2712]